MRFIEISVKEEKVLLNIEKISYMINYIKKYDPGSSKEIKTLIYLPENCLMAQESVEEILKLIEESQK